jgi:hypothetical protein
MWRTIMGPGMNSRRAELAWISLALYPRYV